MIEKVKEILESLDIKTVYRAFKGKENYPYAVIVSTDSTDLCADDSILSSFLSYRCELYNDKKDEKLELKIKKAFLDEDIIPGMSYTSFEDNGKNILITYYEVELEE